MLSLALACSDVRPQFVMTPEGQARAAAEARTTLIVMNGFTYEQGGLRMNGFYRPTKERRGGRRVFEKVNPSFLHPTSGSLQPAPHFALERRPI